ncbi:MAG: LptE family protein [Bacteroidetes bacterium]|nr:LptE family protein [Bacteroidota bacterium]
MKILPKTVLRKKTTLTGWFLLLFLVVLQSSCRTSYSFTGASISPDVKTVSIEYFSTTATMVMPSLTRLLTDAMKDYFTSQSNLILVDRNGDLNIKGTVTGFTNTPVAIQGNETAAMNRITITISVTFTNKKNEKQNFENKTFARYQDYSSQLNLASVQDGLVKQINDQLVQDVFNQAVVNW